MLILCCGHTDRGDGAAGPLVANRLHAVDVKAHVLTGEAYSLMEAWRDADEVVVVDAVVTGAPHGTVSSWDAVMEDLSGRWFRSMPHLLGVAEAVGIARNNGTLPRRLRIYGIEGRYFELGSRPSSVVLRAVDRLADDIAAEVAIASPL